MRSAGRRREDARRPPFRVAGPRRPPVRSRPRRDGRGQWCGGGEWGGGPVHGDDRGPVRARVCCVPFPLLRLLTLHCTRKGGVAGGEGAQQTGKGVADAKVCRGRPGPIPPPPAPLSSARSESPRTSARKPSYPPSGIGVSGIGLDDPTAHLLGPIEITLTTLGDIGVIVDVAKRVRGRTIAHVRVGRTRHADDPHIFIPSCCEEE